MRYKTKSQRALGIDPGIANTGLAVVVRSTSGYNLIDLQCVTSKPDEAEPQRLLKIFSAVDSMLDKHTIDFAAIERVYHNKNVSSSIKTGKAIGAVLCAIGAQAKNAMEVTPQQVKKASGLTLQKADKAAMIRAMSRLFGVREACLNSHTADAAATAMAGLLIDLTLVY